MDALKPTLHGYFRIGAYHVSDTYRTRIRIRYAADTYPRSIRILIIFEKIGYAGLIRICLRIRVFALVDTAQPNNSPVKHGQAHSQASRTTRTGKPPSPYPHGLTHGQNRAASSAPRASRPRTRRPPATGVRSPATSSRLSPTFRFPALPLRRRAPIHDPPWLPCSPSAGSRQAPVNEPPSRLAGCQRRVSAPATCPCPLVPRPVHSSPIPTRGALGSTYQSATDAASSRDAGGRCMEEDDLELSSEASFRRSPMSTLPFHS
jgi:hypothetical protein